MMKNVSPKGHRILLMDDDRLFRWSMLKMLGDGGYVCCETVNGEEAVDHYREAKECGCPFDAVLLDLNIINGMGGKAAVRKLLEIDADARVILASGDVTGPVIASFKDYGFKAVLNKPFTMEELYHTLQQVLEEC